MSMRVASAIVLILTVGSPTRAADSVDFTRDIRPILAGRCFKCHGPDPATREAGLRLDDAAAAAEQLESGTRGIVPGDPSASEVLARVTSTDPAVRMPPMDQGDALTPKQVEQLSQWIQQGAKYDEHWSFTPPLRPSVASLPSDDWCQNPIDRFVLARLRAQGLEPSREADRYALARRVYLDLTGLPPSVEQVDAFVNNPSPSAYEELVDELLQSPGYGERWGRIWLDLSRYADSAGYADDPPRSIWMYRDWVIQAINANLPFDAFTTYQLAGDMLEQPTNDQLIATAFHRNTMTNSEGGTDDEEFRTVAIVDRVNTTLQVWMGVTMGCAQCHTHKYDPISQEEYYKVYAILNQTEDADRRDETPTLEIFTEIQQAQRMKLMDQLDSLEADLRKLVNSETGAAGLKLPEGELKPRFVRLELAGKEKILSLAEVQTFAGDENIALKGKATQSSTAYEGDASRAIDGNTNGHYYDANSTTHTETSDALWWELDLGQAARLDRIVVWNRTDSDGIGKRLNGVKLILLGENREPLWVHDIPEASPRDGTYGVPAAASDFNEADKAAWINYAKVSSPEIVALQAKVDKTKKDLEKIKPVTTPVYRELPPEKHRKTHIQVRGNFLDLGPEVTAGVVAAFSGNIPFASEVKTRLDLSRWLTDPGNPLTARVIANRHWEALFGIGLVETSEDFGMQGELPSHPELLDWLAVELRDSGWDTKHLVRTIVLSATYRQDSNADGELAANDPLNRLLARGPRYRLPAETVRDQALAIGGILSDKMFGPPVLPPRPKLGLTAAFGGSTDWETSPGEDRHRRGLYTRWQRTLPYPSMDAFDAPSREVCTIRRIRTNTPLQALVTLNDPVYIEAAQGLAGRMLTEGGETKEERLQYGFRLCAARPATTSELAILGNVLTEATARFQKDIGQANNLPAITTGDLKGVSRVEEAAWTVVANVLLNLDETLARR